MAGALKRWGSFLCRLDEATEGIMARLSALSISSLLLAACLVLTASYAHAHVPIRACGNINQPGNYLVENDLAVTIGGTGSSDCLVISAPNVIINMQSWTITAICINDAPACFIYPYIAGGTAIHIMRGADHVILSNVNVSKVNMQNYPSGTYASGIVDDANYTLVTKANLSAAAGVTLNDASYSIFKRISYSSPLDPPPDPTDPPGPASGPIIAINGGGHNIFSSTRSTNYDLLDLQPAVRITNSSYNIIQQIDADAFFYFCNPASGQAGTLLTQNSSHNIIDGNQISAYCGNGIEVDLGSDYNLVLGNVFTVETPAPPGFFAALDENPNCGHNLWVGNTFMAGTYPPGQPAVSPDCIH
jgi:hypothetical protein